MRTESFWAWIPGSRGSGSPENRGPWWILRLVWMVCGAGLAVGMEAIGAESVASGGVRIVVSTEGGARRWTEETPRELVSGAESRGLAVHIDLEKRGQSILGFGASFDHATCTNLAKLPPDQRDALVDRLVNAERGMGMNLMRLCIGTSDFTGEPYYTYDDMPEGQTDPELSRFSIERDRAYVLPAIRLALQKNPGLLLFASPWSPPAWMKTSGKLGTGEVKPEFYPAYAQYLVKFIEAYAAEGVPVYALTVQNEPQHEDLRYPTTRWNAAAQRDFIRDHLGPLFEKRGVRTRIWCWDHNWNKPEFPRTILSDPAAARFVEGTAFHHYEGQVEAQSDLLREFPDKPVYFTEGSVFRTGGALRLIDILRHGARSYNAWVILLDEHRKPNRGPHPASATCVELLDDGSVRTNDDFYMQGQFMRFIRRGAVRLESTPPRRGDFGQVAFLNPDGGVVLVAANAGKAPQAMTVTCAGRAFSADLPALGVATFLWRPAP